MPGNSTTHDALKTGYAIPVAQRSDDNNKLLTLIESFEKETTNAHIRGEDIGSTDSCAETYSDSDDGTMFEPC
jgi:hypothetical protein